MANGRGDAAQRAADSLLWNTGGKAVALRLPMPAIAGAVQEQIGLGLPGFQDVVLAPVAFRKCRAQVKASGAASYELLVSARCVEAIAGSLNGSRSEAATALFATAYGVVVDEVLMAIESVTSTDVAGFPCVYRLYLLRPISEVV